MKAFLTLGLAVFVTSCAGTDAEELHDSGRIAALRGGRFDTCAVYEDGRLKCWGNLGTLSLDFSVLGSHRVVDVGLGAYFICALLENGEINCWGDASRGQLGIDPTVGPQRWRQGLPAVDLGTHVRAQGLALGAFSACALTEGGGVKCWGHNIYGALGLGDTIRRGDTGTMGDALPFVDLGANAAPIALAAGLDPVCALLGVGQPKPLPREGARQGNVTFHMRSRRATSPA